MLGFEWWEFLIGAGAFAGAFWAVPYIIRAEREARCQHVFEKHGLTMLCHKCGLARETKPDATCRHKWEKTYLYAADGDKLPSSRRWICLNCGAKRQA